MEDDPSKGDRSLDRIYPDLVVRFHRLVESMVVNFKPIFLVEGFRSFKRQKWLYDKKVKVTQALPGQSWHNYGLALDIAFLDKDPFSIKHPWRDLRRLAIANGFEPISRYDSDGDLVGDLPHFQLRYGMTLDEVKTLYDYNGLEAIWCHLDKKRGVPIGDKWLMGPPPKV